MDKRLKLRAETAEDMTVLSAMLQDAAVRVGDFAYAPRERRFVLMANRFRWERETRPKGLLRRRVPERVRAVFRVDYVDGVRMRQIDRKDSDRVLDLLAIAVHPPQAEAEAPATLTFTFAGGAAIRLEVEVIDATLDDLSTPWPAQSRPVHDIA